MMANAFTVIGDIFPPAERGKYQGLVAGVFGLSSIIGPTLGGFITDNPHSWHWVFFVNIPLGVVIAALFIFFFPPLRPDQLKHKIDYLGIATLILAVVPMLVALTWGGVEYPWGSVRIISMFVFSAAMILLFILFESRAEEPIIPLWILKKPIVGVSIFIIFITGVGMFGGIIFIPLFFQGVLGQSATNSGAFLTPMMLGLVAGSVISGQLLSRAGGHYRILGMVGLAIMAVGMFMLSRMSAGDQQCEGYNKHSSNRLRVGHHHAPLYHRSSKCGPLFCSRDSYIFGCFLPLYRWRLRADYLWFGDE